MVSSFGSSSSPSSSSSPCSPSSSISPSSPSSPETSSVLWSGFAAPALAISLLSARLGASSVVIASSFVGIRAGSSVGGSVDSLLTMVSSSSSSSSRLAIDSWPSARRFLFSNASQKLSRSDFSCLLCFSFRLTTSSSLRSFR